MHYSLISPPLALPRHRLRRLSAAPSAFAGFPPRTLQDGAAAAAEQLSSPVAAACVARRHDRGPVSAVWNCSPNQQESGPALPPASRGGAARRLLRQRPLPAAACGRACTSPLFPHTLSILLSAHDPNLRVKRTAELCERKTNYESLFGDGAVAAPGQYRFCFLFTVWNRGTI